MYIVYNRDRDRDRDRDKTKTETETKQKTGTETETKQKTGTEKETVTKTKTVYLGKIDNIFMMLKDVCFLSELQELFCNQQIFSVVVVVYQGTISVNMIPLHSFVTL